MAPSMTAAESNEIRARASERAVRLSATVTARSIGSENRNCRPTNWANPAKVPPFGKPQVSWNTQPLSCLTLKATHINKTSPTRAGVKPRKYLLPGNSAALVPCGHLARKLGRNVAKLECSAPMKPRQGTAASGQAPSQRKLQDN